MGDVEQEMAAKGRVEIMAGKRGLPAMVEFRAARRGDVRSGLPPEGAVRLRFESGFEGMLSLMTALALLGMVMVVVVVVVVLRVVLVVMVVGGMGVVVVIVNADVKRAGCRSSQSNPISSCLMFAPASSHASVWR